MKKVLACLLGLTLSITIAAQNFGGGAYAGLVTSQMDGDGIGGFDLWGVHAGVFTDFTLSPNSKIQLEIAFIQKGSRQVPDSTNGFVQYKARTNYIEVPLLYRFRWNDLSFELGPALDINVSASEEFQNSEEPNPDFERFHLTGIVGINYHFNRNWYVNFRSNISITPARKLGAARGVPGRPILGGGGQRHIVLSTAVVYFFGDQ